ncbi:MAG: hypothetical protein DMF06_03260 [Verrucomicrobia bacterium]|nr:MAG: hypothetical protein DMF06_03260 [Verrucomicrobiota bacterium]
MNLEFQSWVRLVTNIAAMLINGLAIAFCIGLWMEDRRLYLAFGATTLLMVMLLLLLRIASIPEFTMFSPQAVMVAGLVINALVTIAAFAWFAALLYDRLRASRLRRKYGLDKVGESE